jgi:hypothetical protein
MGLLYLYLYLYLAMEAASPSKILIITLHITRCSEKKNKKNNPNLIRSTKPLAEREIFASSVINTRSLTCIQARF